MLDSTNTYIPQNPNNFTLTIDTLLVTLVIANNVKYQISNTI